MADAPSSPHPDEVDVLPERARELIDAGAVQLVDVREPAEHAAGRIPGSRHIPLDRLAAEAGTLDPDRPVLFYCRVGGRSSMAADAFRGAGFRAHSLSGGLLAWHGRGLPLEPEDGAVAGH